MRERRVRGCEREFTFVPEKVRERDFAIDHLLVRVHLIIVMIRWTGLSPWRVEFPFPGSRTCTVLHEKVPHPATLQ